MACRVPNQWSDAGRGILKYSVTCTALRARLVTHSKMACGSQHFLANQHTGFLMQGPLYFKNHSIFTEDGKNEKTNWQILI